eukprot:3644990-Pleurochrysis_carterae.AAC.1
MQLPFGANVTPLSRARLADGGKALRTARAAVTLELELRVVNWKAMRHGVTPTEAAVLERAWRQQA